MKNKQTLSWQYYTQGSLTILGNISKRDDLKHATEALNFGWQPFGIPVGCITSERGSASVDIHEDSEHEMRSNKTPVESKLLQKNCWDFPSLAF